MSIKTISFSVKHSDLAFYEAEDENGNNLMTVDGYAPKLNNVLVGGDYTEMTIDNATGKIIGWVPVTMDKLPKRKKDKRFLSV